MREFLRVFLLLLMVAWGTQGYAEYVEIKPSDFHDGYSDDSKYASVDFNNKDITVSSTKGKYWNWKLQKKDSYAVREYYKKGNTGATYIIPIGSDVTITCNNGWIDYVAISFNNGSNDDHSTHWSKINVKLDDGTTVDTKNNTYYHPHSNSVVAGYNKAWWGRYGTGVKSITFVDDRDDYAGSKTKQYETTGLLWFYVFYHKASTAPTVTINNNGIPTFYDNSGGKVTMSATGSGDNNSGTAIYYTDNNTQATTSGTKYDGNAIENFSCSKKFRAISQSSLKVKDLGGDVNDDDFTNLPGSYNVTSSEEASLIVRKAVSVNLNNSQYATFAHAQNMIVPTGCKAATYKVSSTNSGNARLLATSHTYNAGDIIAVNNAVVVWRTGSAQGYDFVNTISNYTYESGHTNAFDDKSNNCLSGNFTYDDATAADDNSYFYYLMKEYSYSDSRIGFFWAKTDGAPALLGPHKAYFKYGNRNSKAKSFLFQLPDTGETTAIGGITTDSPTDDNAPMYNAAGQRVGASYKGLVIQNGRKFIKR